MASSNYSNGLILMNDLKNLQVYVIVFIIQTLITCKSVTR